MRQDMPRFSTDAFVHGGGNPESVVPTHCAAMCWEKRGMSCQTFWHTSGAKRHMVPSAVRLSLRSWFQVHGNNLNLFLAVKLNDEVIVSQQSSPTKTEYPRFFCSL